MTSARGRGVWIGSMVLAAVTALLVSTLIQRVNATGVADDGRNPQQLAQLHYFEANKTFGNITVGTQPKDTVFDGYRVWVANAGSNTVQAIDVKTGVAGAPIAVGVSPIGMAFDGTNVWVSNFGAVGGSLSKINVNTNAVTTIASI